MKHHSRLIVTVAALTLAALTANPHAQQTPQTPAFRAGIDILRLDVSVVDKDHQPVRGLTAADFTILENGKPRNVVAFVAVDVPIALTPTAAWLRDVAPDVRANTLDERRLIVLAIDDWTINGPAEAKTAGEAARMVVSSMGSADLMAVIFARDNRHTQDFTADRARLQAAINTIDHGVAGIQTDADSCTVSSINMLGKAAEVLRPVTDRRKAIIYVGGGVPLDFSKLGTICNTQRKIALDELFRQTQLANVNVYPIDVRGLLTGQEKGPTVMGSEDTAGHDLAREYLQIVARGTGGRPIINNNQPEREVPRIFAETGAYYLLGYEVAAADPKSRDEYRRLEVKVGRKDVEVHARSRYYEAAPATQVGRTPTPSAAAIAGVLPARGLPLRLSIAPLAVPGSANGAITVVLAMDEPPADAQPVETLDITVALFDPEGRPRGSGKSTANVSARPGVPGLFEIVTRMDVPPGRYGLRLSISNARLGKAGSVYADVDVPDFAQSPLSLSGVLVESTPPPVSTPEVSATPTAPVAPTAQRVFATTDAPTAFVRVYQGSSATLGTVKMLAQVTDDHDARVFTVTETLDAARFSTDRAADYRLPFPLTRLQAGEYLLTLDATMDGAPAVRRSVRFTVR